MGGNCNDLQTEGRIRAEKGRSHVHGGAVWHARFRAEGNGVAVETGYLLWKALETGTDTLEGLVAALRAEYDVSEEQATADTQAFLDSLREQGVLEA